jgi:Circadian oscillating protein COP23
MRRLNIASISAMSLIASVSALSMMPPAHAGELKFSCGTSKGAPATVAQTSRGAVPIIRWVANTFTEAGYSPEYRCKLVSAKFQEYYKAGTLNYLTTGIANNQPVVCVASTKGGPCAGVLFTMKPGSDPWRTLTRLMDVRVQAGPPLNESSAGPSNDNSQYVDMADYLATAPTEEGSMTTGLSPANPSPVDSAPATPASAAVPVKSLW